jgi:hypothetical protein
LIAEGGEKKKMEEVRSVLQRLIYAGCARISTASGTERDSINKSRSLPLAVLRWRSARRLKSFST